MSHSAVDHNLKDKTRRLLKSKFGFAVTGTFFLFPIILTHFFWHDIVAHKIAWALEGFLPNLPFSLAKRFPEAEAYFNATVAVCLYTVAIGAVLMIQYIFALKSDLSEDLRLNEIATAQASAKIHELSQSIQDLRESERLDYKERVTFGLFDNLMIYAPIYLAKGLGYFDDEMLNPIFRKIGDDVNVAKAVKEGAVQFGVCDPVCCVPNSFDDDQGDDDLLVLMPLTKRFGITTFGRKGITPEKMLSEDRKYKIGTYETGSTTYLTALWFKMWLIGNLADADVEKRKFLEERVELEPISVNDTAFERPEDLSKRVRNLDFMLLWQPHVSWVLRATQGPLSHLGVVQVQCNPSGEVKDLFRVAEERKVDKLTDTDWKPWTPYNGRSAAHRCLVSAVVTTRYMIFHRPELCRRVFRSVSRAMVRMHNSDWTIDGTGSPDTLFGVLRSEIKYAEYLDPEVFHAMAGAVNGGQDSTFPFISGLSKFKRDTYAEHLKHCHELWLSSMNGRRPEPSAMYARCFVDPASLLGSGH